jgi:DNA-binding NarL/FixJ family response regulator
VARGVIFASRAVPLHPDIKRDLECFGFKDVTVTANEKDGLYMLIDELKPRLLMMSAKFYEAGTPYMMGKIVKRFPGLRTAAVSTDNFPLSQAVFFKWRGVKSYVNKWEGMDEFEKGMKLIRDGEDYFSPMLQTLIDNTNVYTDIDRNTSKRLLECLIMLCCGFKTERIGDNLHVSKKTIENHLQCLYDTFHVDGREEMVAMAWRLELVTKEDIQFYDNRVTDLRTYGSTLPDWAKAKRQLDRTARDLNLFRFSA